MFCTESLFSKFFKFPLARVKFNATRRKGRSEKPQYDESETVKNRYKQKIHHHAKYPLKRTLNWRMINRCYLMQNFSPILPIVQWNVFLIRILLNENAFSILHDLLPCQRSLNFDCAMYINEAEDFIFPSLMA